MHTPTPGARMPRRVRRLRPPGQIIYRGRGASRDDDNNDASRQSALFRVAAARRVDPLD